MRYIDLQMRSEKELLKLLKEKKLELFTLKVKHKTMQLKNTNELKVTKKDIAKIKTAIALNKKTTVQVEKKKLSTEGK